MFDLITDSGNRPLRERSVGTKIVAVTWHVVVIVALLVIPLLRVGDQLPPVVPTIMAFVSAQPAEPPPPPPPPPPAVAASARPATQPARTAGEFVAPLEAPADVQPERSTARNDSVTGVIGGIEGGVPGGVVGGVVGGIVSPAPPPPPPPVARGPVRIGGQITSPALLHRVEPVYPDIAATAHLTGIVILEATVDAEGCVQTVKVLRSRHPLLDKASEEALMQWRYSPLILNGFPTPFVLTVTFSFSVR